jgi:hypothetical protein
MYLYEVEPLRLAVDQLDDCLLPLHVSGVHMYVSQQTIQRHSTDSKGVHQFRTGVSSEFRYT